MKGANAYVARRIVQIVPTVLLVLVLTFILTHLIPGDPVAAILGPNAKAGQAERLREQLGLDKPIYIQFALYLGSVLQGDLGTSIMTHRPVSEELLRKFPATLELNLAALFFGSVIGILTGVVSSVRRNSLVDYATRFLTVLGISMPIFWLALLLQLSFGISLKWLPISGRADMFMEPPAITGLFLVDALLAGNLSAFWNSLEHLILPALVQATFLVVLVARILRSKMLDVLGEDYVRTARSKGLSERAIVFKHALRNALLPTVTIIGLNFGFLLGGTVITEKIFAWPGMGRYMFDAITTRDFPVIQGCALYLTLVFALTNLIVDVAYAYIDPRIRNE